MHDIVMKLLNGGYQADAKEASQQLQIKQIFKSIERKVDVNRKRTTRLKDNYCN